jgi:hypothetical protein
MRRRKLVRLAAGGSAALLLGACAAPPTPTAPAKPIASAKPPSAAKTSGLPVIMESPPDLTGARTWFNSKPLTLADLKGQPFLMVFWTYT